MQSRSEVTAGSLGRGVGCTWSFLPEASCCARPVYEGEGKGAAPLPPCPPPPARACPAPTSAQLESQLGAVLPACQPTASALCKHCGSGCLQAPETWRGARQKGVGCAATPPRWVSAPGSFPGSKPTCSSGLAAQKPAAQPVPPQWRMVAGQPLPP